MARFVFSKKWAGLLTRMWRLVALVCAAGLLHRSGVELRQPGFSLDDARAFFTDAARIVPSKAATWAVEDSAGMSLGLLVQTSPESDHVVGYAGPTNLLVAFDNGMKLVGMRVLESADTPAHVDRLRKSPGFEKSLLGWKPALEPPPRVEGVAGSTLTALAMVEAVVQRMGGRTGSLRFPEQPSLAEVQKLYPNATAFEPDPSRPGWFRVKTPEGDVQGFAVRTSPESDGIFGYAGPTECWVAVARDAQTVREIRIRKSYDTEEYVERVREDTEYLKSLTRWRVDQWPGVDFGNEKIEGVAGATETSYAVAEAVRKKLAAVLEPKRNEREVWGWSEIGMGAFLAGALGMSFSRVRGRWWARRLWQLLLIGGFGIWMGQLLSVGVFTGWARHGIPWRQCMPLVALALVALSIPWGTGRQIYCHQLCPHGAAQEWLGKLPLPRLRVAPRWDALFRTIPGIGLVLVFFAVLKIPGFVAANWEPFDFWGIGFSASIPAIIACIGLAASCWVPMAHCRYGCITGELLRFVRCDSTGNVFGVRDVVAAVVLVAGAFLQMTAVQNVVGASAVHEVRGVGFGTTWCVKSRGAEKELRTLRGTLANEVERIESTLSHWRRDSATSRFNANLSTDLQSVPEELGRLVSFSGRLSAATSGAYDITVAPLVDAWGFGPGKKMGRSPSEEEISEVLSRVGWEKVVISQRVDGLQKTHPRIELDLGSILQGYAVDRLHELLTGAGIREFLVEVGGELRASGSWKIAIENPEDASSALCVMELRDAALATSGAGRTRGGKEELRGHKVCHILSPRTGRPVECDLKQLSVRAATCLEADGWATALFASGSSAARRIAQREGLSLWMLESNRAFEEP